MKKKIIIILLVIFALSSIAAAQTKYQDLKADAEQLRREMMDRRDEIAQEKSDYKKELSLLLEEKRENAKSFKLMAEQTIDSAKAEQYRYNARFNKFLADLIEDNLEYGFSQLIPANKELIDNVSNDFEFHWHPDGGYRTLEKLAGIYFLSYENNKLIFLEKLIHENISTGIAETIRNYYQDDLDQRWNNKASDPGDYNGAVIWSNKEKPTYDLLYKIHQEFKKMPDQRQLEIIEVEEERLDQENDFDRKDTNQEIEDQVIDSSGTNAKSKSENANIIVFSRDDVYLKSSGSKSLVDPNINTSLPKGTELITESDIAYAEVKLSDYETGKESGYKLAIWPEAAVTFANNIFLNNGFVQIRKEHSSAGKLELETTKSAAVFDGDNLIAYLDNEGNTVYFVEQGALLVESKTYEQKMELGAGETMIIFEDGYLSRPEEMTADDYEIFEIDFREYWESENQGF